MSKLKLFALPHAGGSAASLLHLRQHLSFALEFRAVELPGRGVRINEPLVSERSRLVEQLADELAPELGARYALFGHSLGATVAFELAHALMARGRPAPSALCVAAAPAPSVRAARPNARALSDQELTAKLLELGGTPAELFQHPQALELFLPIVRADFALCEGDSPGDLAPLPCPIHVYAGTEDRMSPEQLHAWRAQTRGECTLHWFSGGHFFVRSRAAQMGAMLVDQLIGNAWNAAFDAAQ